MSHLAPIGVSTYARVNHLKKTIQSLQKNSLAKNSILYIFSDSPRLGDEERVKKVRDFIHTISGFKKVHIVERETNNRMLNSRNGILQLLERYGRCIFLEEDVVTSRCFLSYMNHCLLTYKDNKEILSISGYSPNIQIDPSYPYKNHFIPRFNGWGFATWADRFDPFMTGFTIKQLVKLWKTKRQFVNSNIGKDFWPMALQEAVNKTDALDVKIMFLQANTEQFTCYPAQSYALNIGHDGSGEHCGVTGRFSVELSGDFSTESICITPFKDPDITKKFVKFRATSTKGDIVHIFRFMLARFFSNH